MNKSMQHFHCKIFVYRAIVDKEYSDNVEFDLIDDNVQKAIGRAVDMAKNSTNDEGIVRKRWSLRYIKECFNNDCVSGNASISG